MLLPLRSIPRRFRPLQPSHTRFVTTLPTPLPSYKSVWDPTRHEPRSTVSAEQDPARRRWLDLLRTQRAQRQESQKITVVPKGDTCTHEDRIDVEKLNRLLWLADTTPTHPGLHLVIRRTYFRLKHRSPEIISTIPERAWDIIWRIQKQWGPSATKEFETDMASCGYHESVGQRVGHLDNLFAAGQEEQALKEWNEDYEGFNGLPRHDHKPEHLELGARLYALSGDPERARLIMHELFELHPSWNRSIMKTVFRAHTSSPLVQNHDHAYNIYKTLKESLGDRFTLEDCDSCFVGFLEARHLYYAKLVFRDMIKQGHIANSNDMADVKSVLSRLHMLYRLATSISKMTTIGLQAIKSLPSAYHPHVFAHWLRSAVVKNAPEAAGQVLEMMFRRNCQPDATHFNLYLKALMRTKVTRPEQSSYVSKAENIGWRMIAEARKAPIRKFPQLSAAENISSWADEQKELVPEQKELVPEDEDLEDQPLRHVPMANVTTFAIMMKHHGDNEQWEHVYYLERQLKGWGIRPNTALMNILMDNKCRQGKYSEVWEIYKSFTHVPTGTPGVFPDGASIRCLWKTLRLALGNYAAQDDSKLPRPRELLAETVQWWERCRARSDVERFLIGLATTDHEALTALMMHCFSYTNDLVGSLVGMHILHKKFDILPSDKSAVILQRHVAWVDMGETGPVESTLFQRHEQHRKNLEKMGRIYHILLDRRTERTKPACINPSESKSGEDSLTLNILSEFIRVVLKRTHSPETIEVMIMQAKEEVGVPEMATGDMDAFQVV